MENPFHLEAEEREEELVEVELSSLIRSEVLASDILVNIRDCDIVW